MIQSKNIYKSLFLFLLTAVVITFFYPQKSKFNYAIVEGQPWQHELLTAPFDFPVFKTRGQIQFERDSLSRALLGYYTVNTSVFDQVKSSVIQDQNEGHFEGLQQIYVTYLIRSLEKMYHQGIMDQGDYDKLNQRENKAFNLVDDDNIAKKVQISDVYSLKEVYEKIIDESPKELSKDALRSMAINRYIRPNVNFNEEMTNRVMKAKEEEINSVQGKVQTGVKIVSTGDVVSPEIAAKLYSLKKVYDSQANSRIETIVLNSGRFLITFIVLLMFLGYLYSFRPKIMVVTRNILFFLCLILLFVLTAEMMVKHELASYLYIIPFATLPILVRTFFDTRTAFYAHIVTICLAALVASATIEFVIIQFVGGAIAILTLVRFSQRSDLVRCSFYVLFSSIATYVSFQLFFKGELSAISFKVIIYFFLNFVFLLMLTYLLVYMLEKIFGYVSNISLVELSDTNTPTLRQLSEMAPGTFQHSIQVSNLATSAAAKIGADVQLIRTGALYHDIGKMKNPTYFTENQGDSNPHDKLSYDESARIIIKHVLDGVEMAEKIKLPKQIIDFIRTHHGLGKAKYFYNSYKNEHPNEVIDESIFTYPGPNPFSKETGILMLADAVEASSRSLTDLTEDKVDKHISKIVDSIVEEGLLKNTPLTFKDVEMIKQVFFEKLKTMYHSRIKYPELKTSTGKK